MNMESERENKADSVILKFFKNIPQAYSPVKGSSQAAGYDLKSAYDYTILMRNNGVVDTGLTIILPEGCYGRIAPRSGLAVKKNIDVGAGVIDRDYRGSLKIVLFNHSNNNFEIKMGDRVAQLILEKIYYANLEEIQEITKTDRGEGSFGSTGMK